MNGIPLHIPADVYGQRRASIHSIMERGTLATNSRTESGEAVLVFARLSWSRTIWELPTFKRRRT